MARPGLLFGVAFFCASCTGSSTSPPIQPDDIALTPDSAIVVSRVFPTNEQPGATLTGCLLPSPVLYETSDGAWIITTESSGNISALDPMTGALEWAMLLPSPEGEDPVVVATPLLVGDRLFVSFHTTPLAEGRAPGTSRHSVMDPRLRHRVAVVDLSTHTLDPGFDVLELEASLPSWDGQAQVPFLPSNALGRGALIRGLEGDDTLGRLYLTFGNGRDLQPWHGWAFEVDLDTWLESGVDQAISGRLVSTPEADCGPAGASGSTSRICGGGIWSPAGPLVIPRQGSYEVILPTGNGVLDLDRKDYANTLMRTGPGLEFTPKCSAEACANFDPDEPARSCVESCEDLFIPRLMEGQDPPRPTDGRCEDLGFFECWEEMDYIGGSTPAYVELADGPDVLAYPTKDGHIYLVDAQHLGTLYDRKEIAAQCGGDGDPCRLFWAGMIVTQPALTEIDGTPTLIIPTFMPDNTNPAGIVALEVRTKEQIPYLEVVWTYPDFDTSEAIERFRIHPSRPRIAEMGPEETPIVWVVETASPGKTGRLMGVNIRTGEAVADLEISGPGMRFTQPLVYDNRVYINHCASDVGPSFIEAFELSF